MEQGVSKIHFESKIKNEQVNQKEIDTAMSQISLKYQFVTPQTAFVAIEERDEVVEGTMKKVVVPLQQISSSQRNENIVNNKNEINAPRTGGYGGGYGGGGMRR